MEVSKSEARLTFQNGPLLHEILMENLEIFWGLQIQSPQITPAPQRRIRPAYGELKKIGASDSITSNHSPLQIWIFA